MFSRREQMNIVYWGGEVILHFRCVPDVAYLAEFCNELWALVFYTRWNLLDGHDLDTPSFHAVWSWLKLSKFDKDNELQDSTFGECQDWVGITRASRLEMVNCFGTYSFITYIIMVKERIKSVQTRFDGLQFNFLLASQLALLLGFPRNSVWHYSRQLDFTAYFHHFLR